jgi:hypothetical protein
MVLVLTAAVTKITAVITSPPPCRPLAGCARFPGRAEWVLSGDTLSEVYACQNIGIMSSGNRTAYLHTEHKI